MKENEFLVEPERAGQRIDNFLINRLRNIPKSRIYKAFRKGEIRLNKGRVKPSYHLQSGDIIRIPPPFLLSLTQSPVVLVPKDMQQELESRVLYQNGGVMVLDKPAGLAVHAGTNIKVGLIEALRAIGDSESYFELVHRLDRNTSGCIMIAQNRTTLLELHQLLQQQKITKRYVALVRGNFPQAIKEIAYPLRRNTVQIGERMVMVDQEHGKSALTKIKVLQSYGHLTLVEAYPVTGRTHQIRVHLASCGYPIVGDHKYGDESLNLKMKMRGMNRMMLHSHSLSFQLSDMSKMTTVIAPLPRAFSRIT